MARRRRKRRKSNTPIVATVVVLALATYITEPWSVFSGDDAGTATGPVQPALTTDRPETHPLDGGSQSDVAERGTAPSSPAPADSGSQPVAADALLASAREALSGGDFVLARAQYTEAMQTQLSAQDQSEVRTELRKLGRQTVFSNSVAKNDPLVSFHTIKPGESLLKIAKAHAITADLLARINNIADKNRIQAGRRIKVVEGPFHAELTLSTHTLDVYLGATFVDHFKVGLGIDGGTPTGKWIVRHKLKNPTYHPPRGGKIIAADDPQNPLGERWIGLEGVEGDAVGQLRYGIHGTIEPESIGKNVSMGCIRLHNEDVDLLFDLLVEKKSTLVIRE